MERANICDFGDILGHAETIGYSWNQAHKILVNNNYAPIYGSRTVDISEVEEMEDGDAKKILLSFMKNEKVEDFVIQPKSC